RSTTRSATRRRERCRTRSRTVPTSAAPALSSAPRSLARQECKMNGRPMRKLVGVIFLFVTLLACAAPVAAQQRPLDTQDPETIGAGRVLVEGGISAAHDITYPLSGFKGDLWQLPVL